MEILKKGIYYTRVIFFIAQFFLLFSIISSLFQIGWYILIFGVVYLFYIIKTIMEMLSQKKIYQDDWVYNLMQIGLDIYIFILFYRITFSHAVVVKETMKYFLINFGIVSGLIIFILAYSYMELRITEK